MSSEAQWLLRAVSTQECDLLLTLWAPPSTIQKTCTELRGDAAHEVHSMVTIVARRGIECSECTANECTTLTLHPQ
eukprot:m.487190 g.487190  ORF g.487190 m.487190 type:complete len:76 (-) comp83685_c0_seq1:6-233(-)